MRAHLTILLPIALLTGEATASQAYMTILRQPDRSNERDRERNLRSQESSRFVVQVDLNEEQFKRLSTECVDRNSGITEEELNEKLSNYKEFGLSVPMSKFQKLVVYDYEWRQLCKILWDGLSNQNAADQLIADFDAFNKAMNKKRWNDLVPRFLTDLLTPPRALYD